MEIVVKGSNPMRNLKLLGSGINLNFFEGLKNSHKKILKISIILFFFLKIINYIIFLQSTPNSSESKEAKFIYW